MGALPPDSRHADPAIQRLLDWLRKTFEFTVDRAGTGTVAWDGTSPESGLLTLTHGFGKVPTSVQGTPSSRVNGVAVLTWSAKNASVAQFRARTADGSTPVADATATIDYLLVA